MRSLNSQVSTSLPFFSSKTLHRVPLYLFVKMPLLLCGRLLRLRLLSTPLLRTLTTAASTASRPPQLSSSSFTLDFLTTSCGLTPAQALSAARTLRFDEKTRHQPESVLALLRSHGFTDAQIAEIVSRWPYVLRCKAEKNLGPKLQFLTGAGFSSALIARQHTVLRRSLDWHIRPSVEFLLRFLGSADDVRTMIRRSRWCLNFNMKDTLVPNVGLLLELGVAAPAISWLIVNHLHSLMTKREQFAETVQIVRDWGVRRDKMVFVYAVRVVCGLRKSTLAAKLELFKKLGWSDEEVMSAFRRNPLCAAMSEQKLMRVVSFARKLGLGPSDLSRQPKLLLLSFDRRILPRYAVWRVLTAGGLIEERIDKLLPMIDLSEKRFLDRYIKRYVDKVPELMDVYLGKIEVEGLHLGGQ